MDETSYGRIKRIVFDQFPHHEIEMLKFVFWFVFLGLFFIILLSPSHGNSKNILKKLTN